MIIPQSSFSFQLRTATSFSWTEAGTSPLRGSGLMSLAHRARCASIKVQPVQSFCDPLARRWAFEATVYKTQPCMGFVGFGDADPSQRVS